jgi:hypothetical protein
MSNSTAPATDLYAEYLGYRYDQETDDQGDNIKLFHNIIYVKTGRLAGSVNCSPYSEPTVEEVRRQIEFISECNCEQFAAGVLPKCYEPANLTEEQKAKGYDILDAAERKVKDLTPRLKRGGKALAFKGRKIKPGTEVLVFWVGEKRNPFSNALEMRAGVNLPDGSKVFCDAGNLQPLPSDEEMAAFKVAQLELKGVKVALSIVGLPH